MVSQNAMHAKDVEVFWTVWSKCLEDAYIDVLQLPAKEAKKVR